MALRSALGILLNSDTTHDPDQLLSQCLPNAYSYCGDTAGEWSNQVAHMQGILEHVVAFLNTNGGFEVDNSFQLYVVHVVQQPPGSGNDKRYVPGH